MALIAIGLQDHRTENENGFIIADRKVGILGILSSIAAGSRDGGGMIFWIGAGFSAAYGFLYMFIGFFIACILISIISPRARKIAKNKGYITISQVVREEIGPRTEKATALVISVFSILLTAAQFYVLGQLIHLILGFDVLNSIIITALVVCCYVCLGGYKSIIKTDILQFFIMLSMMLLLFFVNFQKDVLMNFSSFYSDVSIEDFLSGTVYMIFLTLALADVWQRIFSAKDDKSAKKGVILASISLLSITIPLVLIGISAIGVIDHKTPANEVFNAILNSNSYPSFFISFFTVYIVSMIMSTIDTNTYIFSSSLLENFLNINIKHHKKKYILMSRIIMTGMLLFSAILAMQIENMMKYILNTYALITIIGPLFFICVSGIIKNKNKKLDKYIMWSIILSFTIGCYMFAQGYFGSFTLRIIPAIIFLSLSFVYYIATKITSR